MKTILFQMDGNLVVATWDDFENLQESPAGYGDSMVNAAMDLFMNDKSTACGRP